jgi:transcriptional regulator with XRE-family HTH domain
LQRQPSWFDPKRPFVLASTAAFLRELRGKAPIGTLAERSGLNRYSIGRWLSGKTEPKLPDFLHLIEASSRRALDFVATLVDPSSLPSFAHKWAELQAARDVAYDHPWSHAVLRALELEGLPRRREQLERQLAEALGISEATATQALAQLVRTGQVRKVHGRWLPGGPVAVDTGRDRARSLALKGAWMDVAQARLRVGAPGNFGYSLFAVSRADLRRLRDLHLEYVRAMQALIASSSPSECVGLYCSQLCDLNLENNALERRK